MKPHVRYGLMTGLICSVVFIAQTYMPSPAVRGLFTWGSYFAIAGMIYLACRDKRAAQGNLLTYGDGVGTGMLTALIGGGITAVLFYINAKFFNHTFIESYQDELREEMEKKFRADELKMLDTFIGPGMFGFVQFLHVVFVGLIASLVIAALLKNGTRNPMFPGDERD
jgi:drug/metabolite transporter (DMT)-like permease